MKLYQLRHAIRCHAKFYGTASHLRWMQIIDPAARHLYNQWAPLHTFPIQVMDWADDGHAKEFIRPVRLELSVFDDPPDMVLPVSRVVVTPQLLLYGQVGDDILGRDYIQMRVVWGVQDYIFFLWNLGGLAQENIMKASMRGLALRAAENVEFMAWFFERARTQWGDSDWSRIKLLFNITDDQLWRFALCKSPREHHYDEDVQQIAEHIGFDPRVLRVWIPKEYGRIAD